MNKDVEIVKDLIYYSFSIVIFLNLFYSFIFYLFNLNRSALFSNHNFCTEHHSSSFALKLLKSKCNSWAVIGIIGRPWCAGRYRITTCIHPFRVEVAGPEDTGGREREDNLLCCQYVAHNDRLLDFSDTAIIVAADLDRSSLAWITWQ